MGGGYEWGYLVGLTIHHGGEGTLMLSGGTGDLQILNSGGNPQSGCAEALRFSA